MAIDTVAVKGVRLTPHLYTTTGALDEMVKAIGEPARTSQESVRPSIHFQAGCARGKCRLTCGECSWYSKRPSARGSTVAPDAMAALYTRLI